MSDWWRKASGWLHRDAIETELQEEMRTHLGSQFDPLIESSGPVPERLSGAFVSPRFFPVIGVSPALGRVFTEQEERFGGPVAIVISDGLWRRRLDSTRITFSRCA